MVLQIVLSQGDFYGRFNNVYLKETVFMYVCIDLYLLVSIFDGHLRLSNYLQKYGS